MGADALGAREPIVEALMMAMVLLKFESVAIWNIFGKAEAAATPVL
jgi:hypothetical protein